MGNNRKVCSKCKIEKDRGEFSRGSNRSDKLHSYCKECGKEYKRIYAERNPTANLEYNRKEEVRIRKANWHRDNAERLNSKKRALRENAEVRTLDNERRNLHRKQHPELANANKAEREAKKLRATPPFASKEAIQSLYKLAKDLTKSTGIPHQVDHIVPLRSPVVCGLHWEGNLQVIPKEENIKKSNKIWPDMP